MKIKKTTLVLLAGLTAMVSCNENAECDFPNENKVNFSGHISAPLTRASNDSWEASDAIGIYALRSGEQLSKTGIYDQKENIKYITDSTVGTGEFDPETESDAITFPANGDNLDFVAYYPYAQNVSDYKVAVDVSDQKNISAIDLLYAKVTGKNKQTPKVVLPFSHKLSRVIVQLQKEGEVNLTGAKVTFKGTIVDGNFNLKTEAVEKGTTKSDLTPYKNGDSATAILIPGQEVSDITIVITLEDGTKYEWTPAQYTLKSGKSITYVLGLKPGEEVKVDTDATIDDWENEDNQNGTVNPKDDTNPSTDVSLDKTTITFEATGGEQTVNITASKNWTATSDASWLTLSSASGNGDFALVLTATPNDTTEERTATVTVDTKTITVTQAGKQTTTPPTTSPDLLFAGSDFEDWTAFEGSLNADGLKYAVQSDDGRNGTKAFYLNKNVSSYTDIFTAKVPDNFTAPSKITLYLKGTSTAKSLALIIHTTSGKKYFKLGDCTGDKEATISTSRSAYTGVINTNGQWVKVTLDLSSIKDSINTTSGEDLFTLRLGKSEYNLYIDDITME